MLSTVYAEEATGQYCLCLILCRDYVVSMVTVHGLDAPIKNSRVAFNTSDLFNAVGLSSRLVESCDSHVTVYVTIVSCSLHLIGLL